MEKHDKASIMLCNYLRQIAREKGITHQEIADKTGFIASNVTRMLSGKYSPSLVNFIKLAEAVDAFIFVIDKTADDELVEVMKSRWKDYSTS
ncbi:MAG: helix-turn-helix domain-containing protein [Bacteroidales bacterium]|nr:helix-turn-helix domain-containing protein [Bacteroidales bacterium]